MRPGRRTAAIAAVAALGIAGSTLLVVGLDDERSAAAPRAAPPGGAAPPPGAPPAPPTLPPPGPTLPPPST
ncbi:class F sortase, partial [Geodermatophilus sp. SYSU D00696]